jgi:hypothetical protein
MVFDPSHASVEDLVEAYARAASEHLSATESGNHSEANEQHDVLAAAYRELRARNERDVLLRFLDSQDTGIRSWAAAHALEFDAGAGERVLKEIAASGGVAGFNAEMTLETWKAGELRFP